MEQIKNKILTKLTDKGYNISQQRLIIIDQLCSTPLIDNIDDFWVNLRQHHAISWSTVHKTIRLLEHLGYIIRSKNSKHQQQHLLTAPL